MNQLKETLCWFEEAVREPTLTNMNVQVGVSLEETAEMIAALGLSCPELDKLATDLKAGTVKIDMAKVDRKELLDACCDQIVTNVGVARMFDLDIIGGMTEVNRSNWSKFVDGKPIFNENGKIVKGPNYTPPDLSGLF